MKTEEAEEGGALYVEDSSLGVQRMDDFQEEDEPTHHQQRQPFQLSPTPAKSSLVPQGPLLLFYSLFTLLALLSMLIESALFLRYVAWSSWGLVRCEPLSRVAALAAGLTALVLLALLLWWLWRELKHQNGVMGFLLLRVWKGGSTRERFLLAFNTVEEGEEDERTIEMHTFGSPPLRQQEQELLLSSSSSSSSSSSFHLLEEKEQSSSKQRQSCSLAVVASSKRLCSLWCASMTVAVTMSLLLLVVLSALLYLHANTLPDRIEGRWHLPGLLHPDGVTVEREPNGMIHIFAQNVHDGLFAQGVVTAQERLWQMEFQRRVASGRLSEVVGADGVFLDKWFRGLGVYKAAKEAYDAMDPSSPTRLAVDAYCEGINSYLATNPPLPLEFVLLQHEPEDWQPEDILVWAKMMSFDLAMNFFQELDRYVLHEEDGISHERISQLWPPYPKDGIVIVRSDELISPANTSSSSSKARTNKQRISTQHNNNDKPSSSSTIPNKLNETHMQKPTLFSRFPHLKQLVRRWYHPRASNNWVLHGSRTASGKPILTNDPHLPLMTPSLWMLIHLHSPELSVIGASLAGVPGLILGRNQHIAWGITNVGADVEDVYILDEEEILTKGYWLHGTWRAYEYKKEVIRVKDSKDVTFEYRTMAVGPVFTDFMPPEIYSFKRTPPAMALRWVALNSTDTSMEAFWGINTATNWKEFRESLQKLVVPSSNLVYADREGNIGYQCTGVIPIRPKNNSGIYPQRSNTSLSKWVGYIPFDELPAVLNPKDGFVVSANNKVTDDDYPHLILADPDWEPIYRAQRIKDLIVSESKHTRESMKRMLADTVTLLHSQMTPLIRRMTFDSTNTSRGMLYSHWQQRLLEWNGDAAVDSYEARVFETWFRELRTLAGKETGTGYWSNPTYLINVFLESSSPDPNCLFPTDAPPAHTSSSSPSPSPPSSPFSLKDELRKDDACTKFAEDKFVETIDFLIPSSSSSSQPNGAWGEVHPVIFEHQLLQDTPLGCLFRRERKRGGDEYTIDVGGWGFDGNKERGIRAGFPMTDGPSYRQIVDMEDVESSLFIHPMGQSGNLYSSHYDDYLDMWNSVEFIPMRTKDYPVRHSLHLVPS
ncbi:Penicillin acylase family protein [Balamuthia mandrillaris]